MGGAKCQILSTSSRVTFALCGYTSGAHMQCYRKSRGRGRGAMRGAQTPARVFARGLAPIHRAAEATAIIQARAQQIAIA